MPYCSGCGSDNQTNARFCKKCGLPLASSGALTGRLNTSTLVVGRYLVQRKLGQGGMGAVYLVQDQRLGGKPCALKEMSEQGIIDPIERQAALVAFGQEAQMLAALDHANLPKVTDFFEENGNQYLVMEFVQGETLEKRLERTTGPLPEALVRKYAEQLCDVLDYLHRRQPPIIFRDLKPANIMLLPDDKLKLIDFGIARHFKPGKSKDTQAMGTPGYAAPEQYGKGQSDQRTDIYALGALMHHMLTARDPSLDPFKFAGLQSLQHNVSGAMNQAVQKAVLLDQMQRWRTIQEMRSAMAMPVNSTMAKTIVATAATVPPTQASIAAPSTSVSSFAAPTAADATTTLAGSPQPQQQTVAGNDIQRANFVWFSLVVAATAYLMTSPLSFQNVPLDFNQYSVVIACTILLAYLLTHRPLTMLLAAAVMLAIRTFMYQDLAALLPWPLLLMASVMEILMGLSMWRTRNILFLAPTVAAGLAIAYGLSPLISNSGGMLTVALLAGTAVALLVSNIVNSFTKVGKS